MTITQSKAIHGPTYELMLVMRAYVSKELYAIAERLCNISEDLVIPAHCIDKMPFPAVLRGGAFGGRIYIVNMTAGGLGFEFEPNTIGSSYEDELSWERMDLESMIEVLDYLLDAFADIAIEVVLENNKNKEID